MSFKKHRLKAFGLSLLAALSVMALGVASAQASGEFLLLEGGVAKTFLEHGITEEEVTGELEEPGYLSIGGLGTEISCTSVTPTGVVEPHGLLLGTLLYTGCTALETGALLHELPCTVSDVGGDEELGKIDTNLIHGLIILHNSEPYVLVKPDPPGTVFVIVKLKGAECPVSGEYAVEGTVLLEVALGHALDLLVKPVANQTELFPPPPTGTHPRLRFGQRNATLTGAAVALLNGTLIGKQWGAF